MNASLYIGATGMVGMSKGMNVVSNNLANASTYGYKAQNMQFSDLIYSDVPTAAYSGNNGDSLVGTSHKGRGVSVYSVRTFFREGGFENSNTVTDLAVGGKGFFQVQSPNDGRLYYTRTGDFHFDAEGYLVNPAGLNVMGWPVSGGALSKSAEPIQVDLKGRMPPKATESMSVTLNIGSTRDNNNSKDTVNPYFNMVSRWDARIDPPIADTSYIYTTSLPLYDENGVAHDVQLYIDGAPSVNNTDYTYEYVLASVLDDASSAGEGLHMSGTLTFNKSGQLVDMTAFTPAAEGTKDLTEWTPAALSDGHPQCSVNGHSLTLDFGLTQADNTWRNAPATAADVGWDASKLGGMASPAHSTDAVTAYNGSSVTKRIVQDGYPEGYMSSLQIRQDGTIHAEYSNNQAVDFYKIPICNFTSEDGLRREGGNLFSQAPEAGELYMGEAGTSNFGIVESYTLETSNVDIATEFTNMIIIQRAFQSNSKVVSVADQLLQKAIELKRS